MTLISTIGDCIGEVTWTDTEHSYFKIYFGALLKKWDVADYVTEVDYANDQGTYGWDAVAMLLLNQASLLGFESDDLLTELKRTLDGTTILGSKHLPHTYTTGGHDYYLASRYGSAEMYRFAEELQYLTGKWHSRLAWEEVKTVLNIVGHGALAIDPRDNSYIATSNRFYDENAQFIDVLLTFYELDRISNEDALTYARDTLWTYINTNHWSTDHYDYQPDWAGYECEGAFFPLLIAKLRAACDYNLTNWNRVITDIESRFLNDDWDSPQWTYGETKYYSVVHHHTDESQRRLRNTLGAWQMLHAFYQILDSTAQAHIKTLLDGATKAWEHLIASSGLYVAGDKMFKEFSDDASSSEVGTSVGIVLLFFLGIVPDTGSLYMPVYEWSYECIYCLNHYYSFDYTNRVIRLPVKAGTIKFIYGSTATEHNFKTNGVYDISFTADWNNISKVEKVTDLDPSLAYVTPIARIEEALPTTDRTFNQYRNIPAKLGRTVTRRELKLSTWRDSSTGWFYHTYWDREITMVVVPKNARQLQFQVGVYPRLDAVGVTQSPIRVGDQIKTSDGAYYRVETVQDFRHKDEYVISQCDLAELKVYEED